MSRSGDGQSPVAFALGVVGVLISFVNSIWLITSIRKSHRSY